MGTTLGLVGAYNLAGALTQHPNDPEGAFSAYETMTRPLVDRAQKLFPGAPHVMLPATAWGIWILHTISWAIIASGLANLMFKWKGPPANAVPVEEFGFRQLEEWREYK